MRHKMVEFREDKIFRKYQIIRSNIVRKETIFVVKELGNCSHFIEREGSVAKDEPLRWLSGLEAGKMLNHLDLILRSWKDRSIFQQLKMM